MRFKTIDFPPEVLQAQRDGTLVVFVGAGVSVARPSFLPLFGNLAEQIGTGCSPITDGEHEDQYLGRLFRTGVKVHDLAADILLNPESKPTELHSLLLQLFGTHTPRIVTTNLDSHFDSAAEQLGLKKLEKYYAPALPLGDDFDGIVYLHGSSRKSPNKTVLTDSDFGKAYLTRGGTSRFLCEMFSAYTVLFVGYSHNDTVMKYLARGLPPDSQDKRFAFSLKKDDALWKQYGIRPLHYEERNAENPHYAITESVREWVDDTNRGLLSRTERIRAIAEQLPPVDGEDADYLKYWLADVDIARQFRKIARRPEYITWLEKHGFFECLFRFGAELTPVEMTLLSWLVDDMLSVRPIEVLALIERKGPIIHPQFCRHIYNVISLQRPEIQDKGIWISLLLGQPHTSLSRQNWAQLLSECRWPEDKECAVLIFRHITCPRILFESAFPLLSSEGENESRVNCTVDLAHETGYEAIRSWRDYFRPNLSSLYNFVEPIVTNNLEAAHLLLLLNKRADENRDILSFCRQRIRLDERFPKLFDCLVRAARDILEFALSSEQNEGGLLISRWFGSRVPILKRLAVHGVAVSSRILPDDKIRWVLERNLLFVIGLKPEVFDVLQTSYASISSEQKRTVVRRALLGPTGDEFDGISDETKEYEIFNLLAWLSKTDPKCEIARSALDSIRAKHPDFTERDNPDVNFWSLGLRGVDLVNPDGILAQSPTDFLNKVRNAAIDVPLGERRSDYLNGLRVAVAKDPEWGFRFQTELINSGITDSDIWTQLFNGWREAALDESQWVRWFDQNNQVKGIGYAWAEGVSDVLHARCERKDGAIPGNLMDKAYEISLLAWEVLQSESDNEKSAVEDWLQWAVNSPGGKLARFWLEYVSTVRERHADAWTGIPVAITNSLKAATSGENRSAQAARVVLASQLQYLFSVDSEFARTEIMPLFNWNIDNLTARQCWSGFLGWGHWQKAFLNEMLPFYQQTLVNLNAFPEYYSNLFVGHIAEIAVVGKEDVFEDNWLPSFIATFGSDLRAHFAKSLLQIFEHTELSMITETASRWLFRYWKDRNAGRPIPLELNEINEMALWPLWIGGLFSEAVSLLKQSSSSSLAVSLLEDEWSKLFEFSDNYGEAVADYLLFVLPGAQCCDYEKISAEVTKLEKLGVSGKKISHLRDELLRNR